jgi:predicted dehydrogenase
MIREARSLIAAGALGRIRRIDCEYLQGWLADAEETRDNKQAAWRTDPQQAGRAGCFGDIGSHCQNLLEFVSGLEISAVAADLSSFIPGRRVDDDGNVLMRFDNGARGTISASQIAVGEENGLQLRIYGERGGLRWLQQAPNSLVVHLADQPLQVRRSGGAGLAEDTLAASRLPAGHVEGYLEAFANLYREFAQQLQYRRQGSSIGTSLLPGIDQALRGMRFIDAVVESSEANGAWQTIGR